MLEVRLFGSFRIDSSTGPISISSRPAQSLFAYLVLSAGTPHRREKLAGLLWPDSLEETARDNLRHALWRIRKALPSAKIEYLLTDDLSIAFNASAEYWLDTAQLEKLGESATVNELIPALTEYQGELLPGFYDEWVVLEREHLNSVFEHNMARLLSLLQDQQRWLEILDWGERWIKLGQKPEPAYRALMSAHAAKGDMSRVAATYERCVKSLEEFGMEPSVQTRNLYLWLKEGKGTPELETSVPVQMKPKDMPGTNLPVPITSFIGREKEVKEIIRLLGKNRLITLMGSGGVGKTRLAIESGNRLVSTFSDGIWWVDLVGLNDSSLVPQEVAKVVDVREMPNRPMIDTLVEQLQSREILLVLDNCEHLISACAQLADRLLSGCKKLKILATSREALDLLGETAWPVPSLSLPDPQEAIEIESLDRYESVRLFVDRAELIQPQFSLTEQNAGSIILICRRLSGMPLAIELAAARVKMMSVNEIAKRLDDRFSLLTSGNRNALPRHQTLRAAIDWSYELLTDSERTLFRRLSVFAGGFTLVAAEAICGFEELKRNDVLDLLSRLVDKSLVVAEVASTTGNSHYRLLETIRQYAREKLNDSEGEEVRNLHLTFYINLTEEAEPELEQINQGLWLDQLESEIDNIRAAIDWAVASGQIGPAQRIVGALRRFWTIRAHDAEGLERIKTILDRSDGKQPTPARLKVMNAYFFVLWPDGRLNEAQSLIDEALELGVNLADPRQEAFTMLMAGVCAIEQGAYQKARWFLERSREKWPDNDPHSESASPLAFLGEIAMFESDMVSANSLFQAAFSPFRDAKDYPFIGWIVRRLGQLALMDGHLDQAVTLIRESLISNWEVHDYRGIGACLAAYAAASIAQGKYDRAVRLFGVVDAFLESIQIPLLPFDQHEYEQNISQLRAQLNNAIFEKSWSAGRLMTLDQAVGLALKDDKP